MGAADTALDDLRNLGDRHILEDCLAGMAGASLAADRHGAAAGFSAEVNRIADAYGVIGRFPPRVAQGGALAMEDLSRLIRLLGLEALAAHAPRLAALSGVLSRLAAGEAVPAGQGRDARPVAEAWLAALRTRALLA